MKRVKFYFHDRKIALRDRKKLKLFIENLFIKEKKTLIALSYIFCSDKYLLKINRKFLKHDFYTDIITFDLSASASKIEGEIYISVDRVIDNAKKAEFVLNEELHRVILHGALHLCDYKDKNQAEGIKMRLSEEFYLKQYFA